MKRAYFFLLTALAVVVALLVSPTVSPTASAAEPFTTTSLHFKVTIGPDDDQVCDIVGDVYVPREASSSNRMPAVLTTNGFGGSKDDQADVGADLAQRGYVVLSYSGLGFGGSSCKVTLDDPDYDGKAASQLVSYLGGSTGIAFTDAAHTKPAAALTVVTRDKRDHQGVKRANDPRVATFGGSYGGGFQFAVASRDARVDTLVPLVTWNDLSYSLAPNGTSQTTGVSTAVPGAAKLIWALGFTALGAISDLQNQQIPPDVLPCPNFPDFICPTLVEAGATGFLPEKSIASLRHASVSSYIKKITVPTLLIQGQRDTLFNLNEATATYRALQAQGTETKMIWGLGGHSGDAAPGELTWGDDPTKGYISHRVLNWLERYLKDRAVSTGPEFAYFREWVDYQGKATPAYGKTASFPAGDRRTWRLSGKADLVEGTKTKPGKQALLTPPAGLPTRLNDMDVLGSMIGPITNLVTDLPGTFASWSTAPLAAPLRVAGSPTVKLSLTSPISSLTQMLGPLGELVVFVKVVDIGPDGKAQLINGLEAPVRIADVSKPVTVQVPAIVHQFDKGHRLGLMVAGGSINYRGGVLPALVTVDSGAGQTLSLPVVR
ncbi:MAG: ABC transporter ATP-binding protein [Nocardioidaceae bacterium]|nr:ABC transporter ATP-binding protein [Nocardioidaceae bacterium]